jgi:putative sterol carrier protein
MALKARFGRVFGGLRHEYICDCAQNSSLLLKITKESIVTNQTELDGAMQQMAVEFNPAKAKGVNSVVQLNASGDGGGQYIFKIANEKAEMTKGVAEQPNVTIDVKAEDWLKILKRETDPTMAFMSGKLKITGDLGLMMRFQQMFGR